MSMSDEMVASGQETLRKHLLHQGVSETLINELVSVAARVNYGQTPDNMNGLSGMLALLFFYLNISSKFAGLVHLIRHNYHISYISNGKTTPYLCICSIMYIIL